MIACSIVIPTFDRPEQLRTLLDALKPLVRNSGLCEVIVVSQGTASLPSAEPIEFSLVKLPRPGLTRARNAGIRQAKGNIILFLDDDCFPSPGIIENHLQLHQEYNDHGVIAGSVLDENNAGTKPQVVQFHRQTLEYHCDYGRKEECDIPTFCGCHFSIKRDITRNFLFDPWFRGNAHFEEIDLAMRLETAGIPIRYSSRVSVHHMLHASGGCRAETTVPGFQFNRFFNRGLCFAKNVTLKSAGAFVTKQKHDLEYFSRDMSGHNKMILLAGASGLFFGMAAGKLRRCYGDPHYRPYRKPVPFATS